MSNFFGLDRLITITREPTEVFFNLDPSLYYPADSKQGQQSGEDKNKERLAKVDLLDTVSDQEIG